jgi:hypothetical protein
MQATTLLSFALAVVLFGSVAHAQAAASPQPINAQVTVAELPPEAVPVGTCKESYSGYLEIKEHGKPKNKAFTSQQIGDYVNKRLGEGYSLSLYPQASGRLFVIETCQTPKS